LILVELLVFELILIEYELLMNLLHFSFDFIRKIFHVIIALIVVNISTCKDRAILLFSLLILYLLKLVF